MIGRTFYSTTASTDEIFLWIFCQSTSDIHCYRDVKSLPWNITKSASRAGFSNLPTPPLTANIMKYWHYYSQQTNKCKYTKITKLQNNYYKTSIKYCTFWWTIYNIFTLLFTKCFPNFLQPKFFQECFCLRTKHSPAVLAVSSFGSAELDTLFAGVFPYSPPV